MRIGLHIVLVAEPLPELCELHENYDFCLNCMILEQVRSRCRVRYNGNCSRTLYAMGLCHIMSVASSIRHSTATKNFDVLQKKAVFRVQHSGRKGGKENRVWCGYWVLALLVAFKIYMACRCQDS